MILKELEAWLMKDINRSVDIRRVVEFGVKIPVRLKIDASEGNHLIKRGMGETIEEALEELDGE